MRRQKSTVRLVVRSAWTGNFAIGNHSIEPRRAGLLVARTLLKRLQRYLSEP